MKWVEDSSEKTLAEAVALLTSAQVVYSKSWVGEGRSRARVYVTKSRSKSEQGLVHVCLTDRDMPVDEEDLLIRSSSTLLHILQPQIGLGATRLSLEEDFESKHKRRHAERLDKLALLFVTRTQVAAIATTQKQDNVTVNVILDDSTAVDEITMYVSTSHPLPLPASHSSTSTKRHDEDVV